MCVSVCTAERACTLGRITISIQHYKLVYAQVQSETL
jgi:hypothetical protein